MRTPIRFMHPVIMLAAILLELGVITQTFATARDWFVRPGTEAGDGSRARPFNDPWRALEKCEAGDRIHVAGGSYFGKLGTGSWETPFERVQLLGGYDAQFATRNPWQHPTQLCWDSASKNWPKAERLRSAGRDVVADGLVIDMQALAPPSSSYTSNVASAYEKWDNAEKDHTDVARSEHDALTILLAATSEARSRLGELARLMRELDDFQKSANPETISKRIADFDNWTKIFEDELKR